MISCNTEMHVDHSGIEYSMGFPVHFQVDTNIMSAVILCEYSMSLLSFYVFHTTLTVGDKVGCIRRDAC